LTATDYVTRVLNSPLAINAEAWDALLAQSPTRSPFMRHAYLAALHRSASACAQTGWQAQFITLWQGPTLVAACPLYLKGHSYGEYVFDQSWANFSHMLGNEYYPKLQSCVPFTPVTGPRLMVQEGELS
jgi:predicted N-acyltransferase